MDAMMRFSLVGMLSTALCVIACDPSVHGPIDVPPDVSVDMAERPDALSDTAVDDLESLDAQLETLDLGRLATDMALELISDQSIESVRPADAEVHGGDQGRWPEDAAALSDESLPDQGSEIATDMMRPPEPRVPRCGDGIQDENEKCDDGNLMPGDACDSVCTPTRHYPTQSHFTVSDRVARGEHDWIYLDVEDDTLLRFRRGQEDDCDELNGLSVTVYPPEGDEPLPTEAWRDPFGPDCRWDSVVTQRGRYRIRVEYVGPEADMIFYVTVRQHREISMGNTYRGQFGQQGNDRYEFTMASAGRVILESGAADLNCGGNTWFTLYRMDRGEDVFVELDGNGAGGNSFSNRHAPIASRYALVVRETRDGALADYFLRSASRPVR